jgi:hypothetical protein
MIYESDTDLVQIYDGSAWQEFFPVIPHTTATRVAMGSGSTTSTSYTTPPTTVAISNYLKYRSDTKIVYHVMCTAYVTGAAINYLAIGVNDGTNTTDVAYESFNVTSSHRTVAGTNQITGLSAGTYTFGLRWKVSAQTGATDGNDFWTFSVMETM